ncbi:hypothetical protein BrnapMp067 (mitochondrion) [Brassica napus]|uniref:Uncharacterized protein orf261 n=1 Tax=Brassica napus TaxID=3708 RepID=Q6YSM4_BRANA|nr:hypothetical protein BrnapMp067 [Brassica napus]AKD00225.1 hypothetical protein [Brassica napus]UUC04346.1 hypothetical protein [Brassica napus]UUC04374.1 hypothetical protein [Brassica napus]UUC04449.1 hypothetical protein [Brassica napus]UUC04524.1 hypothetical protein [Brassica napus]
MILSVLSSPALVFGLLVTRAINFVHSVLFPIPVFCSIETFFTYFSSFPIIRKLSMKWQFLWFSIFKFIFSIIMIKLLFSVGYLCFDDLTRAISQFYPPISGFMGGGNTPMPPTNPFDGFLSSYFDNERSNDQRRGSPSWSEQLPAESGLYLNLDVEDQNKDPIEEQVEAEGLRCDRIKEKIIEKTHSLLISKGYHIPEKEDIRRVIEIVMFHEESVDIDHRKRRFYYLYSCLGKEETPFWREILKLLAEYNITLFDTRCEH